MIVIGSVILYFTMDTGMNIRRAFRKSLLSGVAMLSLAGPFSRAAEPTPANDNPAPVEIIIPGLSSNHSPETAIPFTPGEVALVRSFFGDKVVTTELRKYFLGSGYRYTQKNGTINLYAVTCADRKSIEFFGQVMKSDDFSKTASVDQFGVFLHEITHIYQAQNGLPTDKKDDGYKYTLDATRRFTDYGTEQQGALVEDYARHFLHFVHTVYSPYVGKQSAEDLAHLARIVEEQFPGARDMRLALEAKEALQKARISAAAAPAPNLR